MEERGKSGPIASECRRKGRKRKEDYFCEYDALLCFAHLLCVMEVKDIRYFSNIFHSQAKLK